MSLQTRLTDFVTAVATDVKAIRTSISGEATGSLTGLTTTAKTSLVAAINEVKASATGAPPSATEAAQGVIEIATQVETDAGTDDARAITPLKFATRLVAYAQSKSANLTALDIASTAYGRGFLSLANQAGLVGLLPTASETVTGLTRHATSAEVTTGTSTTLSVNVARMVAFAQPLSANLTSLAGQASTAYGRALLNLADQAALTALVRTASETLTGVSRFATQTETNAGTLDTVGVTPLKFQTRLAAFAQPLSANLTTLAGVASGAFGRTLLGTAAASDARTALGLAAVATSGSASDITTGTLPTSVLPPLAVNEVFAPADQTAMLALAAQRGDVAIRQDNGKTYILSTDSPATLADWKQITAVGDVTSVAGRTGAVVLTKADVGLSNVDNTSDAAKPVSTAQQTAIDLRLLKTANLSDLANAGTARTNLGVYGTTEIGNPETDLVAAYNTAKA